MVREKEKVEVKQSRKENEKKRKKKKNRFNFLGQEPWSMSRVMTLPLNKLTHFQWKVTNLMALIAISTILITFLNNQIR